MIRLDQQIVHRRNIGFLLLIISQFSCLQAPKRIEHSLGNTGELTIETFYEDGSLEKIYSFLIQDNDTIAHGLFTAFYKNGQKRLEREFKYDRLEGIEKGYYPSGNLQFIGLYWNNKKVSSRYFFKDVKVQENPQKLLDTILVKGIPYFKPRHIANPGTLLEGYEFYMHNGEKIFQQNYSNSETKEFEKGIYAPSAIIISNSELSYNMGDTLTVAFLVNNPPGYETNHYYFIEGMTSEWEKIEPIIPYNLMNFKLEEVGSFNLQCTSVMKNTYDGTIKSDTVETSFIVKPG